MADLTELWSQHHQSDGDGGARGGGGGVGQAMRQMYPLTAAAKVPAVTAFVRDLLKGLCRDAPGRVLEEMRAPGEIVRGRTLRSLGEISRVESHSPPVWQPPANAVPAASLQRPGLPPVARLIRIAIGIVAAALAGGGRGGSEAPPKVLLFAHHQPVLERDDCGS